MRTHISARNQALGLQNKQVTLTGVIKDEMGAVIPGVNVSLNRDGTKQNMKVSTTGGGEFSFPSLPTGAYTVEIRQMASRR